MTEEIIKKAVNEFHTPLFLFDADELRDRAGRIKELFGNGDRNIGLCYSIKANPFLIPLLKDIVDKYEVCSPGELSICIHYGVEPGMIIYSGVHKELEDITEAVKFGAGIITAESVKHYEMICSVARSLDRTIGIILRLSSGNQFGMSLDDIEHIIKENRNNEYIKIEGLHYFAGTQRKKLKHQRDELTKLKDVFAGLRSEYDIELPLLEYGPGLAFNYFMDEDRSDTLKPLKELKDDLYAAEDFCELTVEMGRFLTSSCGYYITKVCDVKESDEDIWCILDGGINHLNYHGQIMGMKMPVVTAYDPDGNIISDNSEECKKEQTLCGSLCTTSDVILKGYNDVKLGLGDTLVFCNTGAYTITEGLNLFLSRNLPSVYIHSEGVIDQVRDSVETWKLNS